MNNNLFTLILTLTFTTSLLSQTPVSTHTMVMKNYRGDTYKMDLETKFIGDNGTREPGLYLTARSDKSFGYDLKEKWEKKPSDEASFKLGQFTIKEAKKTLPIRIVFDNPKAEEASKLMVNLIKNSPDKLQLSFDATKADNSFTPMQTAVSELKMAPKSEIGELSYRMLEYRVPESAVSVKNLKTGKVMSLTDYINTQIDRSMASTVKNLFGFGQKKGEHQVKDTGRGIVKEKMNQEAAGSMNAPTTQGR